MHVQSLTRRLTLLHQSLRPMESYAVLRQVNRCLFPYVRISGVNTVLTRTILGGALNRELKRWDSDYSVRACSSVDCSTRRANMSSAFSAGRSSRHEMCHASS